MKTEKIYLTRILLEFTDLFGVLSRFALYSLSVRTRKLVCSFLKVGPKLLLRYI